VETDRSLDSDVDGTPNRGGADRGGADRGGAVSRIILLCEVLFHREALARALQAYDDIALIGSLADVHAALSLAEAKRPDVLVVDSPSDTVAEALAAHALTCRVVFIGAVGAHCRQLRSRGGAIFVGASSSLDEVHVAVRFAKPRQVASGPPERSAPRFSPGADSILTRREREVSRLVAGGYSNKEIADACGISIATVKNHIHRILNKLNFQRRTQIARIAVE
jgi:DNA-binding NarL/FixJ family response regulator